MIQNRHIFTFIIFTALVLATTLTSIYENRRFKNLSVEKYQSFSHLNLNDPDDIKIFETVHKALYPNSSSESLFKKILLEQRHVLSDFELHYQKLSFRKIKELFFNVFLFFLLVIISLTLIYFLAERIAIYRFSKEQLPKPSNSQILQNLFQTVIKNSSITKLQFFVLVKSLLSFFVILFLNFLIFSPAYVIAYFLKSSIDTNSIILYFILAVFTNGSLLIFIEKFIVILRSEYKKGYVETAIVKGLSRNFASRYFSLKELFKFKKMSREHIFYHIYLNAKRQFIQSLNELTLFLITSLIIIEMSLNMQGYLGYNLLKQSLYENYHILFALISILFIFIKLIEELIHILLQRMEQR